MFSSPTFALLALLPGTFAAPTAQLEARDGAGSVVTSANGLSWYSSTLTTGTTGRSDPTSYTCFNGPAANFPSLSTWVNFATMWNNSVKYSFSQVGDTPAQIQDIYNAIVATSKAAKVDARYILATILLESSGNLSVPCTISYDNIPNCGLMQSYNGSSFNPSTPVKSINAMVQDGSQGTTYGPGLVQLFNDAADTAKLSNGNIYAVAREYNSGSVNASDLSDGLGANPSYVSDIANYLQGWNGYGEPAAISSSCSFTASTPTPTASSGPTCASTGFVAPPSPTVSGTTSNCCTWAVPVSGDSCYTIDQKYGISLDQFRSWNTYIDAACDNLWASTAYCVNGNLDAVAPVSVSVSVSSTTTTSSASTPATSSSTKSTTSSTTAATTVSKTSSSVTSTATKTTSTKTSSTITKTTSTVSKTASSTSTKASSSSSSTKTATVSAKTKRNVTKTKTKTKSSVSTTSTSKAAKTTKTKTKTKTTSSATASPTTSAA